MYLKKIKPELLLFIMIVCITIMSFHKIAGGTVHGTINPPEAGLRAFLFSGKDTISVNVVNGAFQFLNVSGGNYKLMIEAKPPYQNAAKDGVRVTDGEFSDAGEIELQK
jgi:hypothetical protein